MKVKGKRGELTRNFRHVQLEITKVDDTKLRIDAWFANRKVCSCHARPRPLPTVDFRFVTPLNALLNTRGV